MTAVSAADDSLASNEKRGVHSIQLLRGLAAMLVLFEHAQIEASQVTLGTFQKLDFAWSIGVDIFFVISGFIMVYASSRDFGRPGSRWSFVRRRLQRIVPTYYFYTLAMIAATLLFADRLNSGRFDLWHAISSFLFIPFAAADGIIRPVLQLGWTLNYEMFFYVLFALFLPLPKATALKWLALTMMTIVALGWILKPTFAPVAFWSNSILIEFLLGSFLGYQFGRSPRQPDLVMFLVVIGVAAIVYVGLNVVSSGTVPRFLSQGLPAAVLVFGVVWFMPNLPKGAADQVATAIGDSSYSLYLSHPFTLAIFGILWPFSLLNPVGLWSYVISVCLAALVVAYVSYLVIERPAIALLRGRSTASAVTGGAT